jgi:hypothetical protein
LMSIGNHMPSSANDFEKNEIMSKEKTIFFISMYNYADEISK